LEKQIQKKKNEATLNPKQVVKQIRLPNFYVENKHHICNTISGKRMEINNLNNNRNSFLFFNY
jgi:hypothetical protein